MKTLTISSALAAGLTFAAVLLPGAPATAAEYPWCLRTAGFAGSDPKCRYATFEQCQSASAFSQGWCERNARFAGQEQQVRQPSRNNR
jgi:hypothetical protein